MIFSLDSLVKGPKFDGLRWSLFCALLSDRHHAQIVGLPKWETHTYHGGLKFGLYTFGFGFFWFNVRLELRSGILPIVWDSYLRMVHLSSEYPYVGVPFARFDRHQNLKANRRQEYTWYGFKNWVEILEIDPNGLMCKCSRQQKYSSNWDNSCQKSHA